MPNYLTKYWFSSSQSKENKKDNNQITFLHHGIEVTKEYTECHSFENGVDDGYWPSHAGVKALLVYEDKVNKPYSIISYRRILTDD